MTTKILVWDRIVRTGHWLLAASFIVAYVSAESERWRLIHVVSGGLVFAVVVLRIAWGLFGSQHARFVNFLHSPARAITYLKSLASKNPEHHTGHNPAGGWAVIGLLSLSLLASITGWMAYNNLGGARLGQWHELAAKLCLSLVFVHVIAVIASSYLHQENLISAMLTGKRLSNVTGRINDISGWGLLLYALLVAALTLAVLA